MICVLYANKLETSRPYNIIGLPSFIFDRKKVPKLTWGTQHVRSFVIRFYPLSNDTNEDIPTYSCSKTEALHQGAQNYLPSRNKTQIHMNCGI